MKFTETRDKGNKLYSLGTRNFGQSNEKFENHFRPKEIIIDTFISLILMKRPRKTTKCNILINNIQAFHIIEQTYTCTQAPHTHWNSLVYTCIRIHARTHHIHTKSPASTCISRDYINRLNSSTKTKTI